MIVSEVLDKILFQPIMCFFVSNPSVRINKLFKSTSRLAMFWFDIFTIIIKALIRVDHKSFIFHDHVLEEIGAYLGGPVLLVEGDGRAPATMQSGGVTRTTSDGGGQRSRAYAGAKKDAPRKN